MRLCCLSFLYISCTAAWTCPKSVSHEAWQELVPFLQGEEVVQEGLCHLSTTAGNYTGQAEEGLAHGWGEMKWNNGTRYGKGGLFYYTVGDRYLGQWRFGVQQGVGTLFSQVGIYVGGWKDGLQEGNGTAMYNNGNKYTGQFKMGFKDGYGVFEVANGDVYSGDFKKGKRNGLGIERFYTGERYIGEYVADLQEGSGTAYYSSGAMKYVGEWRKGSPHGNGTYIALNGDRYVGGFRRGVVVGPGTIYETNGNIRFVQQDETIEFRSQANKYLKLLKTISDYLGISDFLQKYVSFYNDVISPTIFSYLPGAGGAKK